MFGALLLSRHQRRLQERALLESCGDVQCAGHHPTGRGLSGLGQVSTLTGCQGLP